MPSDLFSHSKRALELFYFVRISSLTIFQDHWFDTITLGKKKTSKFTSIVILMSRFLCVCCYQNSILEFWLLLVGVAPYLQFITTDCLMVSLKLGRNRNSEICSYTKQSNTVFQPDSSSCLHLNLGWCHNEYFNESS